MYSLGIKGLASVFHLHHHLLVFFALFAPCLQEPFFFAGYIYGQEAILKIKSAKMKCFLVQLEVNQKFKKHCQIFIHGSCRQPIRKKALKKKLLSCLGCRQIWLNLLLDHRHFGYMAKFTKRHWCAEFQSPRFQFFSKDFVFEANVMITHGFCRKSRDPPQQNLVTSGYKPEIKYKYLIILLYF